VERIILISLSLRPTAPTKRDVGPVAVGWEGCPTWHREGIAYLAHADGLGRARLVRIQPLGIPDTALYHESVFLSHPPIHHSLYKMRLSYYAYEGQGAIHEIELKNYFGTKTTKNPSFAKMVSHLKVPMPFLSLFFNVVAFDQDIISMCYGLVGQVQIRSVAVTPTTVSTYHVPRWGRTWLARPPQRKYVLQITVGFLEIIHKLRWETEDTR